MCEEPRPSSQQDISFGWWLRLPLIEAEPKRKDSLRPTTAGPERRSPTAAATHTGNASTWSRGGRKGLEWHCKGGFKLKVKRYPLSLLSPSLVLDLALGGVAALGRAQPPAEELRRGAPGGLCRAMAAASWSLHLR